MEILLIHPVRCYVIAIALQTAGALILIRNIAWKTRKRVEEACFPGDNFIEPSKEGDGLYVLKRERLREKAQTLYLNRCAFAYIAIGYVLGVYGEPKELSRDILAVAVIVMSICFLLLGSVVAKLFTIALWRKDWILPESELPKDAKTTATENDIKKLFL